jgi:hypothetical protein
MPVPVPRAMRLEEDAEILTFIQPKRSPKSAVASQASARRRSSVMVDRGDEDEGCKTQEVHRCRSGTSASVIRPRPASPEATPSNGQRPGRIENRNR